MPLERIIITFEKTGEFRGASATDFDGLPVHLEEADLAGVIPSLNTAAMGKLETIEAEHAAAIAAKDADLLAATTAFQQLEGLRVAMVEKVTTVLQSGEPEQFAALAVEFLTPEQEKIRAEKLAQFEALKAELGM